MKKLFIAMLVAMTALSITVTEAEAKRLGGGGSFGRQSQGISRQAPMQSPNQMTNPGANQAKPATPPSATPQTPPRPASPWRNILGGALLGLGLGALLSHFGIGGALASVIGTILTIALLALAVMFIIRMFRRGSQHEHRPAYAGGYGASRTPEIGSRIEPTAQPAAFQGDTAQAASSGTGQPWGVPADFDVPAFLRSGKTYFIRLQAAWDRADINDIREFTTPEMFGELRQQLLERGAAPNHTDVVQLDAELLGIETVDNEYVASVRFSGLIKESENAAAEPFAEAWNLVKPVSGQGGWVLAGIQQLSEVR